MPKPEKRIQVRVQQFAEQLVGLIRQAVLEELSQTVGSGSKGVGRKAASTAGRRGRSRGASRPGRAHARPARAKGTKRSADELEQLTSEFEAYVRKNPGQRIEQIGKGMGVATKELKLPVMKLIEAGSLKTKGQKRATQYLPR
jgi:hypothetical protein